MQNAKRKMTEFKYSPVFDWALKTVDKRLMFLDNSFAKGNNSKPKRIVIHWTASGSAESAINWLNNRHDIDGDGVGDGSVVYNDIIDRDGTIYRCVDPTIRYANHTGKGNTMDSQSIGIALVSWGVQPEIKTGTHWEKLKGVFYQHPTPEQIRSLHELMVEYNTIFGKPLTILSHRDVNGYKPDFPSFAWDDLGLQLSKYQTKLS